MIRQKRSTVLCDLLYQNKQKYILCLIFGTDFKIAVSDPRKNIVTRNKIGFSQ